MKPPESESEKELGFKARSRVVGCGNFQNTSDATKEEFASCNVDPEVVRFMLTMLASNPTWTALSWDVVCAFLNAILSEKHRAAVRPPKVLERLGLTSPGTVWYLKRALYGLRVSPVEWERARDEAMRTLDLSPGEGHKLGKLTLREVSTRKGLWAIIDEAGNTVGVGTFYVDDGLAVGDVEAVTRVCQAISKIWDIKVQGILSRANLVEGERYCANGVNCPVVSEITFLGTQIQVHQEGIFLCQRHWLLQEHTRQPQPSTITFQPHH